MRIRAMLLTSLALGCSPLVFGFPSHPLRGRQASPGDPSNSEPAASVAQVPARGEIDPQLIVDDLVYTRLFRRLGLIPEEGDQTLVQASVVGTDTEDVVIEEPPIELQAGACCVTSANGAQGCVMTSEAQCALLNGVFEGPGVGCNSNPCHLTIPAIGACCIVRRPTGSAKRGFNPRPRFATAMYSSMDT